jgi:small conductance mechanosensitive channel
MPDSTRPPWVQTLDDWHLLTATKVVSVVIIALILNWLARRSIRRIVGGMHSLRSAIPGGAPTDLRSDRRSRTLTAVLRSTTAAVIWSIAVVIVLSDLGVNVTAFVASASIIGAALAFGAQQIVRDLLAGFFMFTEDQYGVGDSVDLGLASGVVEEVSLRVTRLRDAEGKVWYVPHGQIARVANLSQEWAMAVVDVPVARHSDLRAASAAITEAANGLNEVPDLRNDLLGDPTVLGVQEVLDDRIVLRLVVRTKPGARLEVQRQIRARLIDAVREGRFESPPPAPPAAPVGSIGPGRDSAADGPAVP